MPACFPLLENAWSEQYPDVKLIVATHSILSYNRNEMIPGLNQYASLKEVDGIIGHDVEQYHRRSHPVWRSNADASV